MSYQSLEKSPAGSQLQLRNWIIHCGLYVEILRDQSYGSLLCEHLIKAKTDIEKRHLFTGHTKKIFTANTSTHVVELAPVEGRAGITIRLDLKVQYKI